VPDTPDGYTDDDVEQQGIGGAASGSAAVDPRSPFMHDRDRILYCSAFSALAGKAQVVSSHELAGYHTRLTHSLKVAQVGRRITEMLRWQNDGVGPDPDLVEAACLAHDIGHPPFGHAGEQALRQEYERLTPRSNGRDGFEGNAQNLRILTYLQVRTKGEVARGLHLSRAALDATMKYPWQRGPKENPRSDRKFGVYLEDAAAAKWVLSAPPGETRPRPIEEQIMDWADDVTYACHDLEDFYRTGFIPLGLLFRYEQTDGTSITQAELESFLDYVERKWTGRGKLFDRAHAYELVDEMVNLTQVPPRFQGGATDKVRLYSMTGKLIEHFLAGLRLDAVAGAAAPVRYGANLYVPPEKRELCALLKELIWYYVIDLPALASQQAGQIRIVKRLLAWHCQDPQRLLPRDRLEELAQHQNVVRAACDHVASLTERKALSLFRRMSGSDPGAITDQYL